MARNDEILLVESRLFYFSGAWPWMALLLYKNASTGAVYRGCSGVLVGDRQVLTSAYCIEKAEL